jgi:hypothetical protein
MGVFIVITLIVSDPSCSYLYIIKHSFTLTNLLISRSVCCAYGWLEVDWLDAYPRHWMHI